MRAADDIQKGDWVVSRDGKDIFVSCGTESSVYYYRILVPGDEVPNETVLLRILPGLPDHMTELKVMMYKNEIFEIDASFALKSLPSPEKSRDELRDDVVDAAIEWQHDAGARTVDLLSYAVSALEDSDD